MIPEEGARTFGVAYQLAGDEQVQAATIAYLEEREKQYDQRHRVDLMAMDGEAVAVEGCLVYVASESEKNKNWLGPASLDHIANTIATSKGPSGPNYEYLFGLANAMRDLGIEDNEMFELEALVKVKIDGGVTEVTKINCEP